MECPRDKKISRKVRKGAYGMIAKNAEIAMECPDNPAGCVAVSACSANNVVLERLWQITAPA